MLFYCWCTPFSRFTWIVPLFRPVSEWHQISYLGFPCLIIGVGKIGFSKFRSETAFSKQGYFRHFSKFLAFSQIGLTYLFFAFWRLQRHQNVETRYRLARNHVLLLKMCTIYLIVNLKSNGRFSFHRIVYNNTWFYCTGSLRGYKSFPP